MSADSTGPSYEWMKTFAPEDGSVSTVWQISDGSYVAGGNDNNGKVIMGLSDSGDIIWEKSIPGGDENGSVRFVEESPAGGLYLFTDGENLIKTSSAGNVEWTYHQPAGVVCSIEVSGSADVLMGGDYFQAFLTMLSPEGTEIWNKSLGNPESGGQYRITSVQSTNDGGYIIAGYINPIIYTENYSGFTMKINSDGEVIWARQYGYDDSAMIITIAPLDDGRFASGLVEISKTDISITEDNSVYLPSILILDENGEATSKFSITGAEVIYHIKQASDGGYYLLASRYNTVSGLTEYMLIKTDSYGQSLWTKNFGETRLSSIQIVADGGLLLSGNNENSGEGVIIKTYPDSGNSNETPGFGIVASVSSILAAAALCRLKK